MAIREATQKIANQSAVQSERTRNSAPRIQASQEKQLDSRRETLQKVSPIQLKHASAFVRR